MAAPRTFGDLGLSILGLGAQYPPYSLKPQSLEVLSKRFYPESASMNKVLSINRYTGIDERSSIGTPDHPVVNKPTPPTIAELHEVFMSDGVPLATSAARKALLEAGVEAADVTHMVSTTCTDSANPGYDHFVAKALGLSPGVEKVLLHGVGCSGGLAALRTAANLCLGHAMRGLPARVLVVALEVSTTLARSELESIDRLQETRIGAALFSDCGSAALLSNGIGIGTGVGIGIGGHPGGAVYELLGWEHVVLPDTEMDLGFDVDPVGWKVVLTPRVPKLTTGVLRPSYDALLAAVQPALPPSSYREPADFDWAMHPGGATILTGAERALAIAPEHMRASYDTYINHGNSSSATIFSVLDRLRHKDMDALAPGGRVRDYVVGCAFGPGITVEMCMLKRGGGRGSGNGSGSGGGVVASGLQTPPETESEASSRSEDGDVGGDLGREKDDDAIWPAALEQRARRLTADEEDAFINDALSGVELD